MEWKCVATGFDGNCKLFGVNIFDYEWQKTGKEVTVRDPSHNQRHIFSVWKVKVNGVRYQFAAGEFSNGVWGFFVDRNDTLNEVLLPKEKFIKRHGLLVISCVLNIMPIMIWVLASGINALSDSYVVQMILLVMSVIFLASGLGLLFQFAAAVLAVTYLLVERKRLTVGGIAISVVSIAFAVAYFLVINWLISSGRWLLP